MEPIDDKTLPIDVHISPYEIWGSINYNVDLWERAQKINDSYYVPSLEDTLIMLVAHLATQWMYRVRDVNDCYLLISNFHLDWDYIYKYAKKYHLLSLLNILLYKVLEIYNYDGFKFLYKKKVKKSHWYEKLFRKYNFGKDNVYSSALLQFHFTYGYYRNYHKFFKALYQSLRNTKNHLIYKNRAYKINKKLKIKSFKENDILILTTTNIMNTKNKNRRVFYGSTLQVVDEGTRYEYFESPYYKWQQNTYYVQK